jgi:predicted MFS family arabinose efflux permease
MSVQRKSRSSSLLVDIAPFRSSETFRRLFTTSLCSSLAQQSATVVVAFEVYKLTRSTLDVGVVSAIQLVSIIVCSLGSGALADRVDRRRIIQSGQVIALTGAVALGCVSIGDHPPTWAFFTFPVLLTAGAAFAGPASSGAVGASVPPEQLHSSSALMQMVNQASVIIGPALGGVVIGVSGVDAIIWADAAALLVALAASARIGPLLPTVVDRPLRGVKAIVDGFRFAASAPAIAGIFLADSTAMIFGLPRAVFPALVTQAHLGSASALGLLYAATGVGALIAGFTSGWVGTISRHGLAVILSVAGWGAAIVIFGLVRNLPVDLALLAIAGWSDMLSSIFRGTILQVNAPDGLRARLSSLNLVVVTGAPRLGDLETGAATALFGITTAIVSGGVLCIAGVTALAISNPAFRRYRSPHARPRRAPTIDPQRAEPQPETAESRSVT